MAMIIAEVLGFDIDEVRPVVADTDSIGHTDVTGGSRTTLATGQAVYEAAHDALLQLKQRGRGSGKRSLRKSPSMAASSTRTAKVSRRSQSSSWPPDWLAPVVRWLAVPRLMRAG
jgi:CO/xanthine dehydrogenase Mo-binding subunit